MSCLNTKQKLLLLCSCVAAIAIISSIMVIHGFVEWNKIQDPSNQASSYSQDAMREIDSNLPGRNNSLDSLDMDVSVAIEGKITETVHSSMEPKRKWFAVQKLTGEDNTVTTRLSIESNKFVDPDTESDQGSGSGDAEANPPSTQSYLPFIKKLVNLTSPTSDSELPCTTSTMAVVTDSPKEYDEILIDNVEESVSSQKGGRKELDGVIVLETATGYRIGGRVTQSSQQDTGDKCDQWLKCEDPFLKSYVEKFALLPSCPCRYPSSQSSQLWDESHGKFFTWKEAKFTSAYLAAYHRGAKVCIRSEVEQGSLSAQNCCYDGSMRLITRGAGAGTPDIISPDVSPELHRLVDKTPWIICKGDWTRYNLVRPPNNMRRCEENPSELEFIYQAWLVKNI